VDRASDGPGSSAREWSARAVAGLAVALAVALLGACGESDEEQIRAAVEGVQQAFVDGDLAEVCERLTEEGRRHIGGIGHDLGPDGEPPEVTPCPRDLRVLAGGIQDSSRRWRENAARRIYGVRIDGDRATAEVEFERGVGGSLPLAREDGEWKIDGLYGGMPAEQQEDNY
jgi:hypothetical protein